jgi:hypothetical protein
MGLHSAKPKQPQQTTNNKQQTTNNKQQTTNNKQQTTNKKSQQANKKAQDKATESRTDEHLQVKAKQMHRLAEVRRECIHWEGIPLLKVVERYFAIVLLSG